MNRRIFGFQRRVWWPKWTPASSSSRRVTTGMVVVPPSGFPFLRPVRPRPDPMVGDLEAGPQACVVTAADRGPRRVYQRALDASPARAGGRSATPAEQGEARAPGPGGPRRDRGVPLLDRLALHEPPV